VHLSPENQDNVEMEGPSSPGPQGLSSTSTAPHEFHITGSYTNLIVVNIGYRWEESPPPPINSSKEGQPDMVGEDKHTHKLVCGAIHILLLPLIKCLFYDDRNPHESTLWERTEIIQETYQLVLEISALE